MQPEFSATLLKACKRNFLHTAVETCGFASEEAVRGLIPFTDLFLYDIKAVDSSRHRAGTGRGSEQIKHNAKLLAEAGAACGFACR